MTTRMSIGTTSVVAALAIAAFVQSAVAQTPEFTLGWTVGNGETETFNWNQRGTLNGYGDWHVPSSQKIWTGWNYTGQLRDSGGSWELAWNYVFDVTDGGGGAFVTGSMVLFNNRIFIQNFSLLMTLPTGFLGPMGDLSERGSIVGLVTDLTYDDATVFAPINGRIYTPMIDGVSETPGFLLNDPFQESAGGPLYSHTVGPADFGIPTPVDLSQDVDSSIGILVDFDLTAGDAVTFTVIYEILPAPAGLPVLAAFGLVASRKRRRPRGR